jgi:hypothetical protein
MKLAHGLTLLNESNYYFQWYNYTTADSISPVPTSYVLLFLSFDSESIFLSLEPPMILLAITLVWNHDVCDRATIS